MDLTKKFYDGKLNATLSLGTGEPPRISLSSSQFGNHKADMMYMLGQGLTFSLAQGIPANGSSNWGYDVDVKLHEQSIGLAPTI
mmetsp:Transcript_23077/g.35736  ORF Transcript_23077/g.35736 Transcript_23077/m.35736 type:complete len:84 (-) Transcript_23077:837-1088(-)